MYYKVVKDKDFWCFINWKEVVHFLSDVLIWDFVIVHKIIQAGDFYRIIEKKDFHKSYSFRDYEKKALSHRLTCL